MINACFLTEGKYDVKFEVGKDGRFCQATVHDVLTSFLSQVTTVVSSLVDGSVWLRNLVRISPD